MKKQKTLKTSPAEKSLATNTQLKNSYVTQKVQAEEKYAIEKQKNAENKTFLRKLKYEHYQTVFQLRNNYFHQKQDLATNEFAHFWIALQLTMSNFLIIRWLNLINWSFVRFLNRRKQFTVSMVGEIWWKNLLVNLIRGIFLFIMAVIVLFPFYWMITISFRTTNEMRDGISGTLSLWPKTWSWGAFDFLFNNSNKGLDVSFSKAIGVSFAVAFLSVILQTTVSLLAGFGLSHMKSRANEALILVLLATMMLPSEALLMGQYLLATKINMKDTFPALFVPFIGNAFTIFMFINAFNGINDSIKRAAKIDGVSNFKFFWKVAIPLVSSTIFTAMLISLIASWNAVLWPTMVIQQNKKFYTLPMILWQIINSTGDPNGVWNYDKQVDPQNLKMAASIISILPMFIIFVFTKKYLVKGITKSSGAKE